MWAKLGGLVLKKVKSAAINKATNKKESKIFGNYFMIGGGAGCIVIFFVGGIFVLGAFFLMSKFKVDFTSDFGETDFTDIADSNPVVVGAIDEVKENWNEDFEISGALMMATADITESYNNKLNIMVLDSYATWEDFKTYNDGNIKADDPSVGYKNEAGFPTKYPWAPLLYEMAEEQIGTEKTLRCGVTVETEEGSYCDYQETIVYFEELVDILYPQPECGPQYDCESTSTDYVISFEVYRYYYLNTIYFPRKYIFDLPYPENKDELNRRSGEVFEMFNYYMSLVYKDYDFEEGAYSLVTTGTNPPMIIDGMGSPLGASKFRITSPFGMRFHPILKVNKLHTGVDLSCSPTDAIYPVYDGDVVFSGPAGAYGNRVEIVSELNGKQIKTTYNHMADGSLAVSVGDSVTAGTTKLGMCGSTGLSNGEHLHFEMIEMGATSTTCSGTWSSEQGLCFINPTATINAIIDGVATSESHLTAENQSWMTQAGIEQDDWFYVDAIMYAESSWNPAASNSGGCIGLGQFCGTEWKNRMVTDCGSNWDADPVCQLKLFTEYMEGRYGTWAEAYTFRLESSTPEENSYWW